jgi:peroxiredoxin
MRILRTVLALGVIFGAAFAGCQKQALKASATAPSKPAVDFTLSDTLGRQVTLAEYAGKANVLIHFGATWCTFCQAQVPALNALSSKYPSNDFVILSVDSGEPADKVAGFIAGKKESFTTLVDADGRVANAYGITGIPHNVLVDKNGFIVTQGTDIPEAEIARLAGN